MPIIERWTTKFKIKNNTWVFVPNKETREYGKRVKLQIEEKWNKPDYYFHLRDGGHVEALKCHLNNIYFIHVDIENFFENINKSRVTRNLKIFFGYTNSRSVAIESTVRLPSDIENKYILPFGFVQSPIIASLCLHKSRLGTFLDRLNEGDDFVVSVYMDDIIISGKNIRKLKSILNELVVISEHSKLPLNNKKTEKPSKKITSFNIELSHMNLSINKNRMDAFKKAYDVGNENQRKGILTYMSTINKKQLSMFLMGK